nr:EOG090X07HN [Leptodora kindtii]
MFRLFCNAEQIRSMSRVKRRFTHPPYWHQLKNNLRTDEPITGENKVFIREVIKNKFGETSPIKGDQLVTREWTLSTKRSGVIARNIGAYPLWAKDGSKVSCTLLQVLDNHVVRYTPPEEYVKTLRGEKMFRNKNPLGCLVVGAESMNPEKFTKQYCNLFADAGLMPKKRLARFLITPNAALPPCTPLTANHFVVGQHVDVYGKTVEHGFQGVVKRWGFKGGPASHGATKFHRRGGTIGRGRDKSRVFPGTKMPGHMGSERRYNRGLQIVRINSKYNVIYVRGTVPGTTNSIVHILDTVLPLRKPKQVLPNPTYFSQDVEKADTDICDSSIHPFSSPSITV